MSEQPVMKCAGCAAGIPKSLDGLWHVRYTWDDTTPIREGRRGRMPVHNWKYKDLIPCLPSAQEPDR